MAKTKLFSNFSWPVYTNSWAFMKDFKGHNCTGNHRNGIISSGKDFFPHDWFIKVFSYQINKWIYLRQNVTFVYVTKCISELENLSKLWRETKLSKGGKIRTVWLHFRVFVFIPSFIQSLTIIECLPCTGLIWSFPPQSILIRNPAQYIFVVGMVKKGYF